VTANHAAGEAKLRIAVVGAGAMGSLFGGRLGLGGNAVELVDVDDAHIGAINAAGLHLSLDGTEHIVRLPAGRADAIRAVPDLMIVFTKAPHTEAALASVHHLIGPQTWALTLQNGLGNGDCLARHVAAERILIGVTNWPADFRGPGRIASHGAGEVRLWSYDGQPRGMLERVVRTLSEASLNCTADPTVMVAIWEKVAFNAAMNAVAAVTGFSVGEMADRADLRALAADIVAESVAVARAGGTAIDGARIARALEFAYTNHRAHLPSMLQDLRAGRGTEIDSINGAVLREAARLAIAAPINATLTRLVHALEQRDGVSGARAAAAQSAS